MSKYKYSFYASAKFFISEEVDLVDDLGKIEAELDELSEDQLKGFVNILYRTWLRINIDGGFKRIENEC